MTQTIGITEFVSIGYNYQDIPAKIDTGADSSAIWASNIRVGKDNILRFSLFGKGSKYYTGKIFKRTNFGVAVIKSSNGITEMRYRTQLTISIRGRRIRATFYLSDRHTQKFPILIGRRTIRNKFIVDVSRTAVKLQKPRNCGHNTALHQDPYKFHKKHIDNLSKNNKDLKTAIFTTRNDPSLELLKPYANKTYYYNDTLTLAGFPKFDRVYFRDPFNDPKSPADKSKLDKLLAKFWSTNKNCKSIDNIIQASDLFFEDKYRQYKMLGVKFMPKTFLASKTTFKNGLSIAKKRISSRAKGIILEKPTTSLTDEYIIQPRLDIQEELRIFVIYDKVLPIAAIKSSKTESTKVKIIANRKLTRNEINFINSALQKLQKLDFIGIDLAILNDSSLKIIEVNRSPQFLGYKRTTGTNLAEILLSVTSTPQSPHPPSHIP